MINIIIILKYAGKCAVSDCKGLSKSVLDVLLSKVHLIGLNFYRFSQLMGGMPASFLRPMDLNKETEVRA